MTAWKVFSVFIMAITLSCSDSGGGSPGTGAGGTNPPPTVYKHFVYVVNYNSNNLSSFQVDATTGAMTAIETISAGTGGNPLFISKNSNSTKLFITKAGILSSQSNVQIFNISSTLGTLTPFQNFKAGSAGGETAGKVFPQAVKDAAKAENPTSTCVYCRRSRTGTQVDHAIPRAQGGNATPENAQLACPHCNASKGAGEFPKSPPPGYRGDWPPDHW